MQDAPTLIVGAGLAGLACAQALRDAGRAVEVVDKARGVGGRLATRRTAGTALDHGAPFLHGATLAALARAVAVPTPFPNTVAGGGRPCHPDALDGAPRFTFAGGITALPKALAADLPVTLSARITGLRADGDAVVATFEDGAERRARELVLTPPVEQTVQLLDGLRGERAIDGALALLRTIRTLPTITLLAVFGEDAPRVPWDLLLPTDGVLQMISNEAGKRGGPPAYVAHSTPAFASSFLEDTPSTWIAGLLPALVRHVGEAAPVEVSAHRWRYARVDPVQALARPLLLDLSGGARVGLAGDTFDPHGGAEGAWRAGQRLAERLLKETR